MLLEKQRIDLLLQQHQAAAATTVSFKPPSSVTSITSDQQQQAHGYGLGGSLKSANEQTHSWPGIQSSYAPASAPVQLSSTTAVWPPPAAEPAQSATGNSLESLSQLLSGKTLEHIKSALAIVGTPGSAATQPSAWPPGAVGRGQGGSVQLHGYGC
jgi:hypothetical protein